VGLIERGTAVKEVSKKGDWLEIEAPAGAYAFVAAQYLKQEAAPPSVPPIVSFATPQIEPNPTPTTVSDTQPIAAPPTTPAPSPTAVVTPAPEIAPAPPPVEEPPPRIVSHEGVVKSTWSIQAPTKFALVDPASGKTVNYLYTTSTNLDLRRWKGYRVVVTGQEGLDARWQNTPVITIQRIQIVE
jgi:hypothetical protein